MKKILMSIFEESYFKVEDFPNSQKFDAFYAISENKKKVNYYIVIFIDNLFDLEEGYNFNDFYEDLKEFNNDKDHRIEKNLSMLICARRKTLEANEDVSRNIYQVEEDPYVFKKYVLTYTDQQEKYLYERCASIHKPLKFLYNILHDHDEFLSFKTNPYQESVYNLVSKIFIKLPFLNLKNLDKLTEDLPKKINETLNEDQNELRSKALAYADEFGLEKDNSEKVLNFIGVEKDE